MYAFLGALLGALVLGLAAYLISSGALAVSGMGQVAASGVAPAIFTGAGVGVALGGLVGALIALMRVPPRRLE